MMKRYCLNLLFLLCFYELHAQSLTFTRPVVFLKGATSDKAIDITHLNQHYFVTWKEVGATGNIHARYLGEKMGTDFIIKQSIVPNATSMYAPVFRTADKFIYLFWIANDGTIKYILNTSETGFENAVIHDFKCNRSIVFSTGLSVAYAGKKIVVTSHSNKKNEIVIAVSSADNNGILSDAEIVPIPNAGSSDYPFVVAIKDQSLARLCWSGYKEKNGYYADFNPSSNTLSEIMTLPNAGTVISPALYSVFNDNRLFYIWKNNKKDNRLFYLEEHANVFGEGPTLLPEFFNTNLPVCVSYIDQNNFMLGYTGVDYKLYLSYFSDYNPATWIGDLLLPTKSDYSLKDIVIPGSHDAGMSVLNGTGGAEHGIINECNTLTQTISIKEQLNAGIRMFDLRLDVFNNELYTKHAPADCMEDAVAGGFGEPLGSVLNAVKQFLQTNTKEFVILNFCHFCSKNKSIEEQAKIVSDSLGKEIVYYNPSQKLEDIKLKDIAGKVFLLFENYSFPRFAVDSGSMVDRSHAFINYRRAYAATNNLNQLLTTEKNFFVNLKGNVHSNDLIRLDWQLTETGEEAATICNDFQSEKTNPLVDGALLLINTVKKNKSIIDLSQVGNRYLIPKMVEWLDDGTITKENKPNILYVDACGTWITDFCIDLNNKALYQK